jgi:GntR family transcriptional regulator, transcriptional repressor for pyruvate dehydrogenase complex
VPPDGLHPLRRSPRLYGQVVQQLILGAAASGRRPGGQLPAERDLAARLAALAARRRTDADLAEIDAALDDEG